MRKPAILVAAAVLAIASGSQALSNALADHQPAIAALLSPYAAAPQERLATRLIAADTETQTIDVSAAAPFAAAAVENHLLATEALAILALAEDDPAARDARIGAALAVSRRGRVLNSAAMASAVDAGDREGLLATLNRTLLLYPAQKETMIPLLVQQLGDPQMVPAFVELLQTGPDWAEEFWVQASAQNEFSENLAAIRLGLPADTPMAREADRAVLRLLGRTGRFDDAAAVYARVLDVEQLPVLSGSVGWQDSYVPFDWQLYDVGGRFARASANGESLTVSVRSGYGGVLARRLVYLGDGSTFFEVTHSLDASSASRVRLTLECPGGGARWSNSLGPSPTGMRVDIAMPCDYAWLGIEARAPAGTANISGQILDIVRM